MNFINKLQVGIKNFQQGVYEEKKSVFSSLESQQDPKICLITCADSRICPHVVTSTDPGELFIIRNAGNMIPISEEGSGEIASIEYCVEALNVEHVIIMGHSNCGAMQGIINIDSLSLPHVCSWLKKSNIEESYLESLKDIDDNKQRLEGLIKHNVLQQIDNLKSYSFMQGKPLEFHGWVYDISKGIVEAYDFSNKDWKILDEKSIDNI
ncbi:carbonic anhydrase [Candidatus Uabimicrobium sp. HlEnr_7]|uniref:carbonic anhydrase n=1 Tax=Candidatus Uabimicrobium helgolandensis TaxID=3095367 RepID=UPI0035583C17